MRFKVVGGNEEPPVVVSLRECSNGDVDVLVDGFMVAWFSNKGEFCVRKEELQSQKITLDTEA